MKRYRMSMAVVIVLLCWTVAGFSQERHRLYTETDPANPGGIKGKIFRPGKPILQILAMPPDEPRFVYQGVITEGGRSFLFTGLPMAKYNLFVIYNDEFYEGLELHKEKNTLTKQDLKKIEYIVTESDPFFTKKVIHRVEGTTGRGNVSRLICTMVRGDGGNVRRTFKLIWLKDVGPGWQVVQKRDLYPLWTNVALPKHHFTETLSRIRVTGMRDLGELDLTKVHVIDKDKDKDKDKKKETIENIKDARDLDLTE